MPDGAEVTMRLIDKESPLKATCGDSVMIVMPMKPSHIQAVAKAVKR